MSKKHKHKSKAIAIVNGEGPTQAPTQYYGDGCTHGKKHKLAFEVGKCTIIAGGADDIFAGQHQHKADLYISVGGSSMYERATETVLDWRTNSAAMLPSTAHYYKPAHQPKGSLVIDWPDMGTPPVAPAWWDALAKDLAGFSGTVAIFCQGGHGRTGTALTILASKLGLCGKEDAVEWVRKTYCQKAVESKAQVDYIRSCGITVAEEVYGYKAQPSQWSYSKDRDWTGPYGGLPGGNFVGKKGPCSSSGCKLDGLWDSTEKGFLCDDHFNQSWMDEKNGKKPKGAMVSDDTWSAYGYGM